MNDTQDSPRTGRAFIAALFSPRLLLFTALLGWYLYAVVDLRLVFEARDELFLWNHRFLADFLGRPGDLMKWADSLLVQLCYLGWPAAVALAALTWLLLISTVGFMNAAARADIGSSWFLPAVLLVLVLQDYFSPKSLVIGLTLAMLAANGWVRLPAQRVGLRFALFGGLSVALYYVSGTAYYCFLACCVVYEALAVRKRWSAALLLLAGFAVKFGLDATLAHLDLASRNFRVPSLDPSRHTTLGWPMLVLLGYFPVCAVIAAYRQELAGVLSPVLQRFRKPVANKADKAHKRKKTASTPHSTSRARVPGLIRWAAGTALALALPVAVGCYTLDGKVKAFLEIDCCVERQLWDELLVKAKKLRYYSMFTNHDVNFALYHAGRLPYEMFAYPQQFKILLDQNQLSPVSISMLRKPCSLLLELGRVNEAEHAALELFEMCPTGRTLKRLALVKLIKSQPAAARLFLMTLRDDLILGRWAEESLQRLAADPQLAKDAEVQRVRQLMLPQDDLQTASAILGEGDIALGYPNMLLNLLKHNDRNRMAFEYLMAMHLLERNVAAVVELFPFLERMPYPATPPCYEEAALIFGSTHPQEIVANTGGVFFRGRKISESTLGRYQRLQTIVKRAGGSIERAAPDIALELPGSYFAYYLNRAGKQHD